ncbi:MAG: hypothetical protein P1U81_13895, partial [Verrucomicrobiales bacterium]|nr:hypothetical protein [Verrucomicrobiales bacterium]
RQLQSFISPLAPKSGATSLAQARCEMVKDYLLKQGISADRISIVSFSETQAAATGRHSGGTPQS